MLVFYESISTPSRTEAAERIRVLREYCRGRLPQQIIERPKRGFSVPFYDWLAGPLRGFAHDALTGASVATQNWFHRNEVERWLVRGTASDATARERHVLWNLLVLELWARRWMT